MTTAKHTPGPWEVNGLYQIVTKSHPMPIARMQMPSELSSDPNAGHVFQFEANADLMASAPDLLAALKDCVRELEAWSNGINHRNMNKAKVGAVYLTSTAARAAIAKAEAT